MNMTRAFWWRRADPVAVVVLGLSGLILLIFLVYPISRILLNSFLRLDEPLRLANLTLENFSRFSSSSLYRKALVHSLTVSLAASLLALLIGLPMAFFVARVRIPGKTLLLSLGTLPLVVPPFLGAYSWILLLGRNGILTNLVRRILGVDLPSIYGAPGIILAFTLGYFPYVFLLAYGALSSADPSLEESAQIMGAGRFRITRTITLPIVTPAIAAGMVIIFMQSLGSFGVPAVLGGEYYVLTTLIYFQIVGYFDLNAAGAIALVGVGLTAVSLLLLHRLSQRRGYITVTGATRAARELHGRGIQVVATIYCVLVLAVALVPHLMVLMTSFAETWGRGALPTAFSLGNYRRVFANAWGPMQNSLFLATVATVAAGVLGTLMAYVAVRKALRTRWILDLTITLPFIFPGIAVGVAILSGFSSGPLVLSGTWMILAIAYLVRRMPYIFRSASAALTQIDPAMEEASATCGGAWLRTFSRITLPLMLPGILAGASITFSTLLGELSTTIILYSARWKTMTVAIYEYLLADLLGPASALGTLLTVAVLASMLLANKLLGRTLGSLFRMV
jgi:iron(III) transport system permease protein